MAFASSATTSGTIFPGCENALVSPDSRVTQPSGITTARVSPVISTFNTSTKSPVSRMPDQLDSSDDEAVAPALSAAAEELLAGKAVRKEALLERAVSNIPGQTQPKVISPAYPQSSHQDSQLSPQLEQSPLFSSGSPRVVRIKRNSQADGGRLRRAALGAYAGNDSPIPSRIASHLKTPAPRSRSALTLSNTSSDGVVSSGRQIPSVPLGIPTEEGPEERYQDLLNGASGVNEKSRTDENAPHNSLRVKKVRGRFLSGPARRGVIRRQSEEDQSPIQALHSSSPRRVPPSTEKAASAQTEYSRERIASPRRTNHIKATSATDVQHPISERLANNGGLAEDGSIQNSLESGDNVGSVISAPSPDSASNKTRGSIYEKSHQFRVQPPPHLPSLRDQENEPPPTFKRNKNATSILGASTMQYTGTELPKHISGTGSPVRKALAPRSQNTPRRPAPPPPKMSMLETATGIAGAASTTQRRLKRQYISINGKMFTKMECIGRGGSGRVYRVMAENYKQFALKRVSLEEVDQAAIRGFKGEIDLLRKLEDVDRVIRIYDFEINDEKKTLSVLMDLGELDLKKILDPKLDEETGRFDITFTRYLWKEMLECVQAIHAFDIVHSDLKPANFVSAQGRLKLIDFGIANAIQDDTVNVHREQQIGTPNYMAPEALLDINASGGRKSTLGKLMKLGKPSDVWSLACILYQIVYGKPPFGHISNQMNKVIAITDSSHVIGFPEYGMGKVPVPVGLIHTMRRCLSRDPALRPTISELLSPRDQFLHPDSPGSVHINIAHMKAIQHNVLRIIETYGLPESNGISKDVAVGKWLDRWGPHLFAKMKESMEKTAA